MDELFLSAKQYNALLDHLERIKNDVNILKQKSSEDTYLLDTYDLCRLFQVTYRTIQRWRISGRLPYFKIGRRFYFRADQLTNHLKVRPEQHNDIITTSPENALTGEEKIGIPCHRCPIFLMMIS